MNKQMECHSHFKILKVILKNNIIQIVIVIISKIKNPIKIKKTKKIKKIILNNYTDMYLMTMQRNKNIIIYILYKI